MKHKPIAKLRADVVRAAMWSYKCRYCYEALWKAQLRLNRACKTLAEREKGKK